jgi:diguanylate cyclase
VSAIVHSLVTATGGVLAGLGLAGGLLWRQQRALVRARYDASHDDTTGLPNRRAVITRLHRAARRGGPFGLVLLDLDQFKAINDTRGHDAGNEVLAEIAHRLAALPPPCAVAARLSGDEFVLLVHGDPVQVDATAHAGWHTIAADPFVVGGDLVEVRASVGYACARAGITARHLLREADEAMYRAKTNGSGVHGHTPSAFEPDAHPWRRCRDRRHP